MENNRILQKGECVIRNSFWNRYIDLVKNSVVPYQWDILKDISTDRFFRTVMCINGWKPLEIF